MQKVKQFVDFEVIGAMTDENGKILIYGQEKSLVLDIYNSGIKQYQSFSFSLPNEYTTCAVLSGNNVFYGTSLGAVYCDFHQQKLSNGSSPVQKMFICNGRVFFTQNGALWNVDDTGSCRILQLDHQVIQMEFDSEFGVYRVASTRELCVLDDAFRPVSTKNVPGERILGFAAGRVATDKNIYDMNLQPIITNDTNEPTIFASSGFQVTETRLLQGKDTIQSFSYVSSFHWCEALHLLTLTDHVQRAVFVYEITD